MSKEKLILWVKQNIGEITFREAFDKTGFVINIVVAGDNKFEEYKILNYLTAPNVLIYSAATASCSVPFVFGSSKIFCKDENGVITEWLANGKCCKSGIWVLLMTIKETSSIF